MPENLQDAYITAHAHAAGLLAEISEAVEDMPADGANWGRVATLNLLIANLREAAACLPS